ncbi:hypothetical protein J1N35_008413 [Gossypium stocksii]|uniref:Protein kinase domain-containing protein n=1 Tax=Gossypium stocksii TaxID=47602 RepID=A0A9D4AGG7_9ROSI|nr:hypothetical protein J1N35_008413 [Gossypium stocksii]
MGCVLGKQSQSSSSDRRRRRNREAPPNPSRARRRRSSDESSSVVSVVDSVDGTMDVKGLEGRRQQQRKARHTSDFPVSVPAPETWRMTLDLNQKGWPSWLMAVAGEAIRDWTPRRANTFQKLDKVSTFFFQASVFIIMFNLPSLSFFLSWVLKIGQGTYSNVYKARDLLTGKIVALKKVRFDNLEPESLKFMAREILVLRKLDHPNVIKLQGLVTSRMSSSLYLVFEYMEHDLAGLAACQGIKFTEPQVKCYMKQLLSGLEHCHKQGVLHRDIKGSNLLIDSEGILKIADFGLATSYDPEQKKPLTSRVVTLWYRPPELLLGATHYGVGVDLWSAGCILAELLSGKPTMPGRTEFFMTEPYACNPSSLPKYPPSKEIDVKLRDEEARRQRNIAGKVNAVDGTRRSKGRERPTRAVPAPQANAEIQANLDKWRVLTQTNAKCKSEKFPPPHQDGAVGHPVDASNKGPVSFGASDSSFNSSIFNSKSSGSSKCSRQAGGPSRRKANRDPRSAVTKVHPRFQTILNRYIHGYAI